MKTLLATMGIVLSTSFAYADDRVYLSHEMTNQATFVYGLTLKLTMTQIENTYCTENYIDYNEQDVMRNIAYTYVERPDEINAAHGLYHNHKYQFEGLIMGIHDDMRYEIEDPIVYQETRLPFEAIDYQHNGKLGHYDATDFSRFMYDHSLRLSYKMTCSQVTTLNALLKNSFEKLFPFEGDADYGPLFAMTAGVLSDYFHLKPYETVEYSAGQYFENNGDELATLVIPDELPVDRIQNIAFHDLLNAKNSPEVGRAKELLHYVQSGYRLYTHEEKEEIYSGLFDIMDQHGQNYMTARKHYLFTSVPLGQCPMYGWVTPTVIEQELTRADAMVSSANNINFVKSDKEAMILRLILQHALFRNPLELKKCMG